MQRIQWIVKGIAGVGLCLPLVLYGRSLSQRPPRSDVQQALFQGVTYERISRDTPRPHVIHLVTVDLTAPSIELFVTPGEPQAPRQLNEPPTETIARTTAGFLREFEAQVAINAGYFYPFREKTPWNFYPHASDPVNVVGQGISSGETYSPPQADWPVLCFTRDNHVQILEAGACPGGTVGAIAGNTTLLTQRERDGRRPVPKDHRPSQDRPYARTIAATNTAGDRLWLIVVDGKQPDYSEGITLTEAEALLQELGADIALNLDGGGSTTLVTGPSLQPRLLNAPIHTKWPMRERPVATHLGIYAEPLTQDAR